MYNELAHWKYRSRLQTLKYAWFIRQQTILFTLGYFALHFVSVICPIFPIFWWAIFRVNSMKWKNIPPIFLLLTSLCFASWRTRKPQLFLCSGLILRMNLVSPLLSWCFTLPNSTFPTVLKESVLYAQSQYKKGDGFKLLGSIFTSWHNKDQNFMLGVIEHNSR